jgi:hypothetical protein
MLCHLKCVSPTANIAQKGKFLSADNDILRAKIAVENYGLLHNSQGQMLVNDNEVLSERTSLHFKKAFVDVCY